MRLFIIVTVIATLFYSMTGLVYSEGGFEGALVVKPYPMYAIGFGGGEAGTWARHHPGQTPPWFMQEDLMVLVDFSWEEGEPGLVTAYALGALATLIAWLVLAVIGIVKLIRFLMRRATVNQSFKIEG